MKRNLTKLAKELAGDLLTADHAERTGATVIAYYEPRAGTPRRIVRVIENAGDPYEALRQAGDKCPTDADAILLTTTGWAAPRDPNDPDNETPPSLDPNRLRCALVVARTLTRKQPAALSAIALAGQPTQSGDETGKGPLADALNEAAARITSRRH